MTLETKCIMDLGDISNLVFECADERCRARITRSADIGINLPVKCGACGSEWLPPGIESAVFTLTKALASLRGNPPSHFKLRLEFDGTPLMPQSR